MNRLQGECREQLFKLSVIDYITQEAVVMKESQAHYRLSGRRCGQMTRPAISGAAGVIN